MPVDPPPPPGGPGEVGVSVAMCTYQGERFLAEQLATIAGQTRPPDELVICDDGSTDRTLQIVEDFRGSAGFEVRLFVNDTRLGVLKNFEKATRLSRGAAIFFADQDDIWHPDKLARLLAALDSAPRAGLAFSNVELVDEDNKAVGHDLWRFRRMSRSRRRRLMSGHHFEYVLGQGIAAGMAQGFRAEYKDLVLPFDGLGHDLWVSVLVAAVSDSAVLDEPLGKWRQHRTQHTGAITLHSFRRHIAEAREHNASHYAELARGYQVLLARLHRMAGRYPPRPEALAAIEQKISHLHARAAMRTGEGKPSLLRSEVLSGNYWRHSYGLRSVAKDLLF